MESHNGKQTKKTILGGVSFVLGCILIFITVNNFFQWISTQGSILEGLALLGPFVFAPMGAVGGWIAFIKHRDPLAKRGVFLNLVLFFFLVFYVIVGSVIRG